MSTKPIWIFNSNFRVWAIFAQWAPRAVAIAMLVVASWLLFHNLLDCGHIHEYTILNEQFVSLQAVGVMKVGHVFTIEVSLTIRLTFEATQGYCLCQAPGSAWGTISDKINFKGIEMLRSEELRTKNQRAGLWRKHEPIPRDWVLVQPMINAGVWRDTTWPDGWTSVTLDGKRSAQFEHTLLVTDKGCEVLTARLDTSPPLWWETKKTLTKPNGNLGPPEEAIKSWHSYCTTSRPSASLILPWGGPTPWQGQGIAIAYYLKWTRFLETLISVQSTRECFNMNQKQPLYAISKQCYVHWRFCQPSAWLLVGLPYSSYQDIISWHHSSH